MTLIEMTLEVVAFIEKSSEFSLLNIPKYLFLEPLISMHQPYYRENPQICETELTSAQFNCQIFTGLIKLKQGLLNRGRFKPFFCIERYAPFFNGNAKITFIEDHI